MTGWAPPCKSDRGVLAARPYICLVLVDYWFHNHKALSFQGAAGTMIVEFAVQLHHFSDAFRLSELWSRADILWPFGNLPMFGMLQLFKATFLYIFSSMERTIAKKCLSSRAKQLLFLFVCWNSYAERGVRSVSGIFIFKCWLKCYVVDNMSVTLPLELYKPSGNDVMLGFAESFLIELKYHFIWLKYLLFIELRYLWNFMLIH